MDISNSVSAVKTQLLKVAEGRDPTQQEIERNDAMSREIKRYFNASANPEDQEASVKRLSMFTCGNTGPDTELYIEAVLTAHRPK